MRLFPTIKNRMGRPLDEERLKLGCQEKLPQQEVALAYLFGSYAKGGAHRFSDIDIAILFDPNLPQQDYLNRELELIQIFQDLVEDEAVDLTILNLAPPDLRYRILREGLLLFSSLENLRVNFEICTTEDYFDVQLYLRTYGQELFRQIKEKGLYEDKEKRMVDRGLIERQLTLLRDYVSKLRELQSYSLEEFSTDFKIQASVERFLQLAIECCLNIGNTLISQKGLRRPDELASIAGILAGSEIIPPEFAERFSEMIKFRNRLVHIYWDLDRKKIYQILQSDLGDFDTFARAIVEYLERENIPDSQKDRRSS